jgi:RNA 2',3'-cyclic 3'-phosphodiesterase
MNQTHFFFALRIPEETKLIMKKYGEKLKESIPFSLWVHHEDLHITLAFLGDAPSEKLLLAEKNVKVALGNSNTFNLQINQLGIFGRKESPRIFFADTSESRELQDLRKKVFMACEEAGFQLETRPFRPHITIARKWKGEGEFQMEFLEIWKELQPEPLMFDAAEVVLYQTNLHKTPKYEPITRFPLTTLSL